VKLPIAALRAQPQHIDVASLKPGPQQLAPISFNQVDRFWSLYRFRE